MSRSPDFKYNRTLADVISKPNKPRPLPETGWNKVGLSSGEANVRFETPWVQAFGGGILDFVSTHDVESEVPVSWYHNENGEIRLRGMVAGVFEGGLEVGVRSTIFVLPIEARPEITQVFICPANKATQIIDLSSVRFRAWENGA